MSASIDTVEAMVLLLAEVAPSLTGPVLGNGGAETVRVYGVGGTPNEGAIPEGWASDAEGKPYRQATVRQVGGPIRRGVRAVRYYVSLYGASGAEALAVWRTEIEPALFDEQRASEARIVDGRYQLLWIDVEGEPAIDIEPDTRYPLITLSLVANWQRTA